MAGEEQVIETVVEPVIDGAVIDGEKPIEGADGELTPEQIAAKEKENEPVVFDERQQAVLDKRIARSTKQLRDIELSADELRQENVRLNGLIPEVKRPEVPAIPDRFDFDTDEAYSAAITKRDTVVQEQATFDANQQFNQRQEEAGRLQKQNDENTAFMQSVTTYTERAEKMNITPADLQAASDTINAYGMQDAVVKHILGDDQGPMMTMFLAKNPAELIALSAMTPMQAAVKIAVDIKPKLGEMSNISKAPPPPDTLDGGGVAASKGGPPGATYE